MSTPGRGSTLVEALVALAVAVSTAGAIAVSSRASLRSHRASEALLGASLLAELSLEQTLARDPRTLAPQDETDDVTGALGRYRRRRTVAAEKCGRLARLEVSVSSTEGTQVVFATLVRRPWTEAP